jgi:hypothetical protein
MRMSTRLRGGLAGVLCTAAAVLGAGAPAAQGAFDDPLFVFSPTSGVPPAGGFSGPCGLAVDLVSNFYVSDYYHHAVDVFTPSRTYVTQLAGVDPSNGPCGLAVDSAGRIYVNRYHGDVVRSKPTPEVLIHSGDATGVAVNTATDAVYVNDRDHVAVYDSSGAPVQSIGLGDGLVDGYGVAVSRYSLTNGRVYVPDAGTDTVKAFDPAVSTTVPAAIIAGPPGGFHSLLDSAVAVDNVSGQVYVADRISSPFTDRPESTIQVFDSAGAYKGHLKHNVVDGAPVGLAVDNTINSNQGRVYVTSGNASGASVYAYPPGAATNVAPSPPLSVASGAGGAGAQGAAQAGQAVAGSESPADPTETLELIRHGSLQLNVDGKLSPKSLPRKGAAPISVSVGWQLASTDGAPPPQLKMLKIEINRAGHFDRDGLPTCPYPKIQPATTSRALTNCRSALVGRGSFSALVSLGEQESYVARGEMLVFNGRRGKKPVLWAQIYSPRPFANSFVIPFALSEIRRGRYGSVLSATIPVSLREWGRLTEIQMRLSRRFGHEGEKHSFLSASCPAPGGFTEAVFPLARTSFAFVGGVDESLTLNRSCDVRK